MKGEWAFGCPKCDEPLDGMTQDGSECEDCSDDPGNRDYCHHCGWEQEPDDEEAE